VDLMEDASENDVQVEDDVLYRLRSRHLDFWDHRGFLVTLGLASWHARHIAAAATVACAGLGQAHGAQICWGAANRVSVESDGLSGGKQGAAKNCSEHLS